MVDINKLLRETKRCDSFVKKYTPRLVEAIRRLECSNNKAPDILTYLMNERFIYTWVSYNGVHFWKDPASCIGDMLHMFNAGSAITLRSNRFCVEFMFAVKRGLTSVDEFAHDVVTEVYRKKSRRSKFYKAIGGAR